MNKSLYQISNELQETINIIEDNGGEINEELENKLIISENELQEKAQSYCNVINMISGDIEACKSEKKRINDLQNVRKNSVDKLKYYLLEAVLKFGDDGKSGNKILDLPLYKLFTKNIKSIDINQERLFTLSRYTISYLNELKANDVLETGTDVDFEGMLGAINAIIKADLGESYEPFKLDDLYSLQFNVNISIPLTSILVDGDVNKLDVISSPVAKVENDITGVAENILKDETTDLSKFTIATCSQKSSLVIK